jgi:hypothetical protein
MEELPKKKRIVIGIPGSSFSNHFLISWTRSLYALWESGKYEVIVSPGTSSFVPFARMKTMGLDVLRGQDQKPFNGLEYDIYITIDSDMVFNPDQLIDLIESTDVHNVVAGHYLMADCKSSAVVKDWNTEYFSKNGSFEFMTPKDIETWKNATGSKFIPVSYVGLGFFAIKKEVLDKLKYPYYNSELQQIKTEDGSLLVDICGEDVALCKNIQSAGYQVFVNADIRIGHEKSLIL